MHSKYFLLILISVLALVLAANKIINTEPNLYGYGYESDRGSKLCGNGIDLAVNDISVYIVKAISNMPILPDTMPEKLNANGCELTITAAKGEYEPASFVIRPNTNIADELEIAATPLVDSSGMIPVSNIEIKSVKVWYQAEEAWKEIGRYKSVKSEKEILVPELLLNDDELIKVDSNKRMNYLKINTDEGEKYIAKNSKEKLKKSELYLSPDYKVKDAQSLQPIKVALHKNQQIWVTVYVPENTKAGDYTATITILTRGRELAKVPFKLKVLPFELAEPRLEYGMYYHGRIHDSKNESLSSEYKSPTQLRAELLDMLQHGIKNPIIYQHHYENIELFKEYLTIREELGMDNSKLYFIWLTTNKDLGDDQIDRLKQEIVDLKILLKSFGTKEIYLYGRDEAKGKKLAEQKKAWDSVREMGVKVYVAGYEGTFEAIGKSLDLFVFAKSPMTEEAKKFHSINHKIFNYANPQSGVENPFLYRRNYGVLLWASGFDGAMVYAYQHSMGDAWNDSDHYLYRDHNFAYPTSDGVVKTIAWEGMREAIDDVSYLTMLETEIEVLQSKADVNNAVLIKDAKEYLRYLKKKMNKHNSYGRYTKDFYIDLYKMRSTIIDFLLKLKNKATINQVGVEK